MEDIETVSKLGTEGDEEIIDNEKPKKLKEDLRKDRKNLTIKEVAEHTGMIILDSAFELSNWLSEFQIISSPEYSIISTDSNEFYELETESDSFSMIRERSNSQVQLILREIFGKSWPNDTKILVDYILTSIKLEKLSDYCEMFFWRYLDCDEDGIITNGDLYECLRRFNIWKILYSLLKAANPHVCNSLRCLKRQAGLKPIEYIN